MINLTILLVDIGTRIIYFRKFFLNEFEQFLLCKNLFCHRIYILNVADVVEGMHK